MTFVSRHTLDSNLLMSLYEHFIGFVDESIRCLTHFKPLKTVVPLTGVEPARLTAADFESAVSTNSKPQGLGLAIQGYRPYSRFRAGPNPRHILVLLTC